MGQSEVEHMASSLQDSGKQRQEKLALSRELDRLRPEIEHLQLQLTNHHAVVAEKHRLQRQLDSVEVELENEKRSRQRAQDKESRILADDLKAKAESAQKCLASERREKDKLKKDHDSALSEAHALREQLEAKLSDMKASLSKAQAELKIARAEVDRRQAAKPILVPAALPEVNSFAPPKRKNNKRRSDDSSLQDVDLETPGNDKQSARFPAKKRGGQHAPVGEKSSFSVTPFLNRNKRSTSDLHGAQFPASDRSSLSEQVNSTREHAQAEAPLGSESPRDDEAVRAHTISAAVPKTQKPQKQRGRPKANQAAGVSSTTQHSTSLTAASLGGDSYHQTTSVGNQDEMNQERAAKAADRQENVQLKMLKREGQKLGLGPQVCDSAAEVEGKKRRRKLLGAGQATLFDDDVDDEPIATQSRPGQAVKRKKALPGGLSNAFATTSFSPLKRDRRGVGASFLG